MICLVDLKRRVKSFICQTMVDLPLIRFEVKPSTKGYIISFKTSGNEINPFTAFDILNQNLLQLEQRFQPIGVKGIEIDCPISNKLLFWPFGMASTVNGNSKFVVFDQPTLIDTVLRSKNISYCSYLLNLKNNRIIHAGGAIETMLGSSEQLITDTALVDWISPLDREKMRRHWQQLSITPLSCWHKIDCRFKTKNGKSKPLRLFEFPLIRSSSNSTVDIVRGYCIDLSPARLVPQSTSAIQLL